MGIKKTNPRSFVLHEFPEHAQYIGMIITLWNTIELYLVATLTLLMEGDNEIVYPMISPLRNTKSRIDVLEKAILIMADKKKINKEKINYLIKESRIVSKARNKYAHAHYTNDQNNNLIMSDTSYVDYNREDGLKTKETKVLINHLRDAFHRSEKLANDFTEFHIELQEQRRSSRR